MPGCGISVASLTHLVPEETEIVVQTLDLPPPPVRPRRKPSPRLSATGNTSPRPGNTSPRPSTPPMRSPRTSDPMLNEPALQLRQLPFPIQKLEMPLVAPALKSPPLTSPPCPETEEEAIDLQALEERTRSAYHALVERLTRLKQDSPDERKEILEKNLSALEEVLSSLLCLLSGDQKNVP